MNRVELFCALVEPKIFVAAGLLPEQFDRECHSITIVLKGHISIADLESVDTAEIMGSSVRVELESVAWHGTVALYRLMVPPP